MRNGETDAGPRSAQPRHTPCHRQALHTLTSDNTRTTLLSDVIVSTPAGCDTVGDKANLLQGTLDLLILKTLLLGRLHGWGISKRICQLSDDVLEVGQGSLYPALYRLEDRGWITSEWGIGPEGRRAKFYTLTPAGRRHFAEERANWRLFAGAVEQILQAT